jgi:hypothetical protein
MIINYNDSIYIAAVNQIITWEFNPFTCLCLCKAIPELSTSYVFVLYFISSELFEARVAWSLC